MDEHNELPPFTIIIIFYLSLDTLCPLSSICLSVCVFMSVSLSVCPCLFVCVWLTPSLSIYLSLYFSLCLCLSVSVCLCLCLCLSLSVSLSLSLSPTMFSQVTLVRGPYYCQLQLSSSLAILNLLSLNSLKLNQPETFIVW